MKKRLVQIALFLAVATPAFAVGGTCPAGANYLVGSGTTPGTLASFGITNCYYISKSAGSDTNAGTSEGSPWAHLPGMPSCSNVCASAVPTSNNNAAPGTGFILKGGDTWLGAWDTHGRKGREPQLPRRRSLNLKPDISCALKSGHSNLLTTSHLRTFARTLSSQSLGARRPSHPPPAACGQPRRRRLPRRRCSAGPTGEEPHEV